MKPTRVRLPKNTLFQGDAFQGDAFQRDAFQGDTFQGDAFQGDAWRPDLEALATAKARQDASHRKLDKFITAALAELSDRRRMG